LGGPTWGTVLMEGKRTCEAGEKTYSRWRKSPTKARAESAGKIVQKELWARKKEPAGQEERGFIVTVAEKLSFFPRRKRQQWGDESFLKSLAERKKEGGGGISMVPRRGVKKRRRCLRFFLFDERSRKRGGGGEMTRLREPALRGCAGASAGASGGLIDQVTVLSERKENLGF